MKRFKLLGFAMALGALTTAGVVNAEGGAEAGSTGVLTNVVGASVGNQGAVSVEAELAALLQERHGLEAEFVKPTPIDGLYAVFIDGDLFYMTKDASYVLDGRLVNTQTQEDLGEKMKMEALVKRYRELPLDRAVKQVVGNGERKLVLFSDPACTYCRMLEHSILKAGNVTAYTFVVPVLPQGPVSVEDIVCAKDPSRAWADWMSKGVEPPKQAAGCDNGVIEANLRLARSYNLRGVPFILLKDGSTVGGSVSAEQLDRIIK